MTAGRLGPVARLWWLAARRRWRRNAVIPLAAAALWLLLGFRVLRLPAADAAVHGTVLFAGALLVALFLPSQLRGESPLAATRWTLLPYTPRLLWLLRPLFGDPLRLLLVVPVATWGVVWVMRLGLSPARSALEAVQLLGWTAVGTVVAEVGDELLRRRVSLSLLLGQIVLFAVGLNVLLQGPGETAGLWGGARTEEGWAALLLGASAPLRWEAVGAAAAVAISAALLLAGAAAAERWARTPPPVRHHRTWRRSVAAVGRVFAPRAPASLAKEVAALVRIPVLRLDFVLVAVLAAVAVHSGAPSLLAGCFGLWFAFSFNLLGPDVPGGGTERLQLLPVPLARTLALRHGAVLLCSGLAVGVAVLATATLGGQLTTASTSGLLAGVAWFGYGASLFLLTTLPGDRLSLRNPRPFRVHFVLEERTAAGGIGEGLRVLFALILTVGVGAVTLALAAVSLDVLLPALPEPARLPTAALLAALLHGLVYGLHLRTRLRSG